MMVCKLKNKITCMLSYNLDTRVDVEAEEVPCPKSHKDSKPQVPLKQKEKLTQNLLICYGNQIRLLVTSERTMQTTNGQFLNAIGRSTGC